MSAATYEGGPRVVPLKVPKKPPTRALIVLGLATVLAVGGVTWLRAPKATVTTENAYLKSDSTVVAPRVKGLIAQVLVADNQSVVAGQPLIVLNPEEYAARLASAQGDVAMTAASVAAAESALGRLGAEETLAASSVRVAQTGIRAADAQASRAQADWKRYEALVDSGTVARRDAERVRADAASVSAVADTAAPPTPSARTRPPSPSAAGGRLWPRWSPPAPLTPRPARPSAWPSRTQTTR